MRKKLMILDPLSPCGHFDINKVMVDVLQESFELFYVASNKFVTEFGQKIIGYGIDDEYFKISNNSVKNRFKLYKALRKMMNYIDEVSPDFIIIMSFDILVQSIWLKVNYFKIKKWNNKTRYLCHSNIDELESSLLKRLFFNIGMKKCRFLTYEEYINSFFVEKYGVESTTLHHNINEYKIDFDKNNVSKLIWQFSSSEMLKIIAPSSNEIKDSVIEELIQLDKNGYLSNKNVFFFLKYKKKKYHSKNLWLSGDYLSDDDYSCLFENADFIYLPYDVSSYNYRVSGVYFDAITFVKPIIYFPIMFFIDQEKRFGDIGVRIDNTLKETIDKCTKERSIHCKNSIENARIYYSNENLLKEVNTIV